VLIWLGQHLVNRYVHPSDSSVSSVSCGKDKIHSVRIRESEKFKDSLVSKFSIRSSLYLNLLSTFFSFLAVNVFRYSQGCTLVNDSLVNISV
jgi:hypothetical protein